MSSDPQVMVVDDEAETRNLVSALLQRIGIQPILVKDGPSALTLLEEGLIPSVIILDLMMPDMDGFEVLSRIRRMTSLNHVPVLILSALVDPETIRRGLDNGADGYVTKTYLTHSLLDRVRVLLAAGRQSRPPTQFYSRTAPLYAQQQADPAPPDEPPPEEQSAP